VRAVQRICWVDDEEGSSVDFQRIVQLERLPAAGYPYSLDDVYPGLASTVTDVIQRDGQLPVVILAPIAAGALPADRRDSPLVVMAAGHWSPGHADVEDRPDESPQDAEPLS
jgi:hypothetical protein